MSNNGLRGFSLHVEDEDSGKALRQLTAQPMGLATHVSALDSVDPETAARRYLSEVLGGSKLQGFSAPAVSGGAPDFRSLGTETLPLTGTTTVKFRQMYRKVPVYGSLVTIELDENNALIAIDSSLGEPVNVDPVAHVAPAAAVDKAREAAGTDSQISGTPRLCYYFDTNVELWRLVYVLEDVKVGRSRQNAGASALPRLVDIVIDAHTNELVAEIPRSKHAGRVLEKGIPDGLNKPVDFWAWEESSGVRVLRDDVLNVHTHDFEFGDIDNAHQLPGKHVSNPPTWVDGAVSAHVNALTVATFLREVLKRNGLDGKGGPIISSVNCVKEANTQEWLNAAWLSLGAPLKSQMVYGQRRVGGHLRSYSVALDIVAHEFFHGVTDSSAKLEYRRQSGALNESYSDVFGIIIANYGEMDRRRWNWKLGEVLTGTPLRDLSNPEHYKQPRHMNEYVKTLADSGGVHINSGIPNFAAYKIMTAQDGQGALLFSTVEVAAMFYIALTQRLSYTSQFTDHRTAVESSAKTLFRKDAELVRAAKLQAITKAFDEVGIV